MTRWIWYMGVSKFRNGAPNYGQGRERKCMWPRCQGCRSIRLAVATNLMMERWPWYAKRRVDLCRRMLSSNNVMTHEQPPVTRQARKGSRRKHRRHHGLWFLDKHRQALVEDPPAGIEALRGCQTVTVHIARARPPSLRRIRNNAGWWPISGR